MGQTVSFVARDELAEWLESQAEAEMKSLSAICQDIVAAEYRRQKGAETAKPDQTQDDGADALGSDTRFDFATKREADAVRTQFPEHLSEDDDKRLKTATFVEGTPSEVVKELERRSEG
jgi:hypothetical protein